MICKACNDQVVIAGQAVTDWRCAVCKKVSTHHHDATPIVCKGCSDRLWYCEACGLFDKGRVDADRTS